MLHYMKLQNEPFGKIKNGSKTIEMRLNDEKRKLVNVNDNIEFTNIVTKETLTVVVTNLFHYKDFNELYKNHDYLSLGYNQGEKASPDDMSKYYDKEEIKKDGVLAIEIKVI